MQTKKYSIYIKLILAAIIALATKTTEHPVLAQQETGSFPGKLVAEGSWDSMDTDQAFIYVGQNRLLDWSPSSGQYHIREYDPVAAAKTDLFSVSSLNQGTLTAPYSQPQLVYLGNNQILSRDAVSGNYGIRRYLPASNVAALSAEPAIQGTFDSKQELIYIGDGRTLAWEPASGNYQILRTASTTAQITDLAEEVVSSGTWPAPLAGHELTYLGYNRILDLDPASGTYQIWRYDPANPNDPFSGKPVAEGDWNTIDTDYDLVRLGTNQLLAWESTSGRYQIWEYDLTAIGAFSLEAIAERLSLQNVTGATVIVHGWKPDDDGGDTLMKLAQAIHNKSGGWLLDYDTDDDGETSFFDTCTNDCGEPAPGEKGLHEVVFLFDWAPDTNELSAGWGEAAGDALFSLLVGTTLIDPVAEDNVDLHFIGHSFGTAATSEAIERLAKFNVAVDHVTYLDPHDFNQGLLFDEVQKLFDLGKPPGYGATVWKNVTFADVYYQTRGERGPYLELDPIPIPNPIPAPNGRPIPGAYNWLIYSGLPDPDDYELTDVGGDHGYVKSCFYLGTVTGNLPEGCETPGTEIDFAQTGYAFSRIENAVDDRPEPNFYSPEQDHKYSEPIVVNIVTGEPNEEGLDELGLTPDDIIWGRWQPAWNPLTIVNGNFANYNPGYNFCAGPVDPMENTCAQPGWDYHGGGGDAHFDSDHNGRMEVDDGNTRQTHNRFYIPPYATHLQFDIQRKVWVFADRLEIRLGDYTLVAYPLNKDDDDFITYKVEIPESFLGKVTTLTFKLVQEGPIINSQARIDNVKLYSPPKPVYLPLIVR